MVQASGCGQSIKGESPIDLLMLVQIPQVQLPQERVPQTQVPRMQGQSCQARVPQMERP